MTIDVFFVGIIFLLVWISIILFFFLRGNSQDKELTKLIGGFSVILVSLYAKTNGVYIASVIIAGLIIASERFMSLLVSILRSDKSFLTSPNFIRMIEKMSGDEIEAKKQKEIKEIKEAVIEGEIKEKKRLKKPVKAQRIKKTEYMKKLPEIEEAAINKFTGDIKLPVRKNVKIGGAHIDAIVINKTKRKVYIVEAKVFPNLQGYTEKSISHIIEQRMKIFVPQMLLSLNSAGKVRKASASIKFVLMVLLIVDTDESLDYVKERVSLLKQLYNKSNQKTLVRFMFYNMPKLVKGG